MDEKTLRTALAGLPLAGLRFFDSTGSTNDEALAWAAQGAPDLALALADEQTSGRGRMDRKWFTPRGTALAMSLILRPTPDERAHPTRTTGLLAVSLTESLRKRGLAPLIKWPNDVLLNGRKVAGILVESTWTGDHLDALILGMGVNVLEGAVPPAEALLFPATSIEHELGQAVERPALLRDILSALLEWRPRLGTGALVKAWDENLAFRGQQVRVEAGGGQVVTGEVLGLESDGGLSLRSEHGKCVTVQFGEVHLRPLA
jgi:BirA family biotin operon repressor/biotin-[acetyl-CoA-carboxylase] ligase